MSSVIELNKFDPRVLEYKRCHGGAPIICILGKRNSGKSIIVEDILSYFKNVPVALCMSATECSNEEYSKHIHDLFIYNKFETEVINKLLDNQKEVAKQLIKQGKKLKETPEKGVCIIIDDLAYDKKVLKQECMREIFMNGRHYGLTTIITFQYMMDLKPEFRTNIDYVIVLKEPRKDNVEKLYKYFFGMFDCIADFKKVLNSCTNDYGCLVVDNTSKSDRIEDQVFWYKAKCGHDFKISGDKWDKWDLIHKKKNKIDDDDVDEEGPTYVNKKKTSELVVKKKGPRKFD